MNLRAVVWLLGCVTLILAGFLLVPLGVALGYGEFDDAVAFASAAFVAALLGVAVVAWNRGSTVSKEGRPTYYRREGLAVVGLAWLVGGSVGALPYLFGGVMDSPVDALFESVSGFTTTGSSVLAADAIDALSRSMAFWRSFTHWLGGFGIVMVFVVLFPTGGRSLFRSEVPGIAREAGMQRVRDSAVALMRIYLGLSALEIVLLRAVGTTWFDAVLHTFGTIATGGFSSYGASVAAFDSFWVELVIGVFMFLCGMNFALYDYTLRAGPRAGWQRFLGSAEVKTYSLLVFGSGLVIGVILWFWGGSNGAPGVEGVADYRSFGRALRDSLFQVMSLESCTGYATADYDQWPQVCRVWLMMLIGIGACTGSTGGGVKVIRILIVAKAALAGVRRFARPRAVHTIRVDGESIDEGTVASITGFFALWVLSLLLGTVILAAFGLDTETASTAVLTALSNCGPGLNVIGPASYFGELPEAVKGILCVYMILGRLEFYAVVALLVPGFWRR